MRVARRLLPLLLCGLLAAAPATVLAQGGAGDDQYQDPFGPSSGQTDTGSGGGGGDDGSSRGGRDRGGDRSSGSSGGSDTPASSGTSSGSDASTDTPPLTQDPGLGSAESPGTADTGPRTELPRTGMDAPIVALLGAGLLAAGLGLRLRVRTVDDRRR
jgi:LPXTG-motif cell wall-anchored protein